MHAIEMEKVTKTFGIHTAVDESVAARAGGKYLWIHRPQRLWENHHAANDHAHHSPRPGPDRRAWRQKLRRCQRSRRLSAGGARAIPADESRRTASLLRATERITRRHEPRSIRGSSEWTFPNGPIERSRCSPKE